MKRKIIIFGGTFNPIHNAHLRMARHLRRKFKPNKILFIPCHIPYHKNYQGLAEPRHRLNMARLAIVGIRGVEVSDMDIRRGGRTFSIDTIRALKRKYKTGTEFYFVIGSDSLVDLPRWYKIKELSRLCKFITMARPGYHFAKLVKRLPVYLAKDIKQFYQPDIRLDISSTRIRNNIRAGKSVKSLVPKPVASYIRANNLYS
ncbi:MAG TPA: nicotinate (nicotinamide) nucleotide adenylyltransferase [Planctomycetota bacterium]|nr:nicotinate (nicotinamide) nucleotide adenylyltransferase [Planctomycetota bacterium]